MAVAPPPNTYSDSNGHEDLSSEDLNSEEIAWLNVVEHDNLAKCLNTCVDRWRNAGPEARKKMFALFAIAGIFLAVCHHGHVLVICDMIHSGELCVTSFVMFIVSLTLTFQNEVSASNCQSITPRFWIWHLSWLRHYVCLYHNLQEKLTWWKSCCLSSQWRCSGVSQSCP